MDEIAEDLGMFPGDVERAIKKLADEGKVECYWYEGKLYCIIPSGVDIAQLEKSVDMYA